MLCGICKQNVATVHLTMNAEGRTAKMHLCEDCSKTEGVDDPAGFGTLELFQRHGWLDLMAK